MKKYLDLATVRAWLYGLCIATLPLLLHYGLVDPKAAPLWAGFALALFYLDRSPDSRR